MTNANRCLAGERVLLTLWVGGLWTVGSLVAPVLFAGLDDRALAGTLAGRLFQMLSYIGLFCGGLLLLGNLWRYRRLNARAFVLLSMLGLVAINEWLISPLIADMRQSGAVTTAAFAQVHGAASVVFLVVSLLGLFLVASGEKLDQS